MELGRDGDGFVCVCACVKNDIGSRSLKGERKE